MQKYIYSETRGGLVPDEPGSNTDAVPYTGGWYRAGDVEGLREACQRADVALRYYDPRDTGQKINRAPRLDKVRDDLRAALAGEVQDEG